MIPKCFFKISSRYDYFLWSGMFDRIAETIKEKGLQNNPAMKAFSMMSKLFTKTACGEDRDVDGKEGLNVLLTIKYAISKRGMVVFIIVVTAL